MSVTEAKIASYVGVVAAVAASLRFSLSSTLQTTLIVAAVVAAVVLTLVDELLKQFDPDILSKISTDVSDVKKAVQGTLAIVHPTLQAAAPALEALPGKVGSEVTSALTAAGVKTAPVAAAAK